MNDLLINATQLGISNLSAGIPLNVTMTTTTNPTQYILTLLLGSVMVLWFFGGMALPMFSTITSKLALASLKRKAKRHIMVIKHTKTDLFASSMIDQKTLTEVNKGLMKFGGEPFDLILHTPGGEIFSASFISRLLKNYAGKIRAIVPMYSMSGGTLLALSCSEIHMGSNSCLGPVDPQIGSLFKFSSGRGWGEVVKKKGKKAEDSSIIFDMMSQQYTKSIRNNVSEAIGDKLKDIQKEKFLDLITSGEVEHAFNLTPDILQAYGFNINKISDSDNKTLFKILKSIRDGVTYV